MPYSTATFNSKHILPLGFCLFAICLVVVNYNTNNPINAVNGKNTKAIITLHNHPFSIIDCFGDTSIITAIGEYINTDKQILRIPYNGLLNLESMLSLNPDLIIMAKMAASQDVYNKLQANNIDTIISDPQTIEEILQDIQQYTDIIGVETVRKILNYVKYNITYTTNISKAKKPIKIYIEISPLHAGLWTIGSNNYLHDILLVNRLENIFADLNSWSQVSQEQILAANPDIIVSVSHHKQDLVVQEILERSAWKDINAIKNKQVYLLDIDTVSKPLVKLLYILKFFNKIGHKDGYIENINDDMCTLK